MYCSRYLGLQNYPPREFNPLLSHKENCYRYPFLKSRQQQLCDLGEKIMSVSKCCGLENRILNIVILYCILAVGCE